MDACFIKNPEFMAGEFTLNEPAPIFRKKFSVCALPICAAMKVCALGIGKVYLNGKPVTDSLFSPPYTNYEKTVMYDEYDVTDLLRVGENTIAVALGNGFYNESLNSPWVFNVAPWRDDPKLCLELNMQYKDNNLVIKSDTSWKTSRERSPYVFNQFRMGEIYDARLDTDWMNEDFDDESWGSAIEAEAPRGDLIKNTAPLITVDRIYSAKNLFVNNNGKYVFDFGNNISGFVKLNLNQPAGTRLRIIYAEQLDPNGERKDNHLSGYYKDCETQFSEVIAGNEAFTWSPDFSYYGFRYVIISGMVQAPTIRDAEAYFIHSDVEVRGHFRCSDETLNKIYEMARMATLSNLFNMPTDCPTREKLGWCNDAQASAEQMVQNYGMASLYGKWLADIKDALKDDGDLPGIVPTGGWGYAWGSGPVSTGVLYEVAYRLYQYYGDSATLIKYLPTMLKHFEFLDTKTSPETGLTNHGLTDWAGTYDANRVCPFQTEVICTGMYIRMIRYAALAAKLANDTAAYESLIAKEKEKVAAFRKYFVDENGLSVIDEQAPIAMIIVLGLSDNLEGLKQQLKNSIERTGYHLRLGMVGIQFLLPALDIVGLSEIGYKMLTVPDAPSYRAWIDSGATALHEFFGDTYSCNHHMYSAVVAWFHNTLLGIKHSHSEKDHEIAVSPRFIDAISFAEGSYKTEFGEIYVNWQRKGEQIELNLRIPEGTKANLALSGYSAELGVSLDLAPGAQTYILNKIQYTKSAPNPSRILGTLNYFATLSQTKDRSSEKRTVISAPLILKSTDALL